MAYRPEDWQGTARRAYEAGFDDANNIPHTRTQGEDKFIDDLEFIERELDTYIELLDYGKDILPHILYTQERVQLMIDDYRKGRYGEDR